MRGLYIVIICLLVGAPNAFASKRDNVVSLFCDKTLSIVRDVKQAMPSLFRWHRLNTFASTDLSNEYLKREMVATLAASSHGYAVETVLGRVDVSKPFDLDRPEIAAAARVHFEMSLVNLITNYGQQIEGIDRKRVSAEDYVNLHEAREYIRTLKPYAEASIARYDAEIASASHIHRMNLISRRRALAEVIGRYAAWAPKAEVDLPF